jgi:hypothetical protein
MFDNRWDNWAGDFTESFGVGLFDPLVQQCVPEILTTFGNAVRKMDRDFPDEVSSGTFATVLTDVMPRLKLPEAVRPQVPEVVARFLEYLQDSGRVGEGSDWAAQIRVIGQSYGKRLKPEGGVKGVTIRKSTEASPLGRNDPCPCGSGKKYKKCCYARP